MYEVVCLYVCVYHKSTLLQNSCVKSNIKSKLNADQQNMHGESAFHMYLFTSDFNEALTEGLTGNSKLHAFSSYTQDLIYLYLMWKDM